MKVGVFVNESLDEIIEIAATAKLDAVQLHGEETPEFARELKAETNLEIIKAFRVSPEFKPEDILQYTVDAILLDAYSQHEHGGTGETFDWEIAKKIQEIFPKMYLAGGISKENVILLGVIFKQSLGVALPEEFRFLPMTLLIVTAMLSCYIQFYSFLKLRLAK